MSVSDEMRLDTDSVTRSMRTSLSTSTNPVMRASMCSPPTIGGSTPHGLAVTWETARQFARIDVPSGLWPDAPAHNNHSLRYWLRPKGLNPTVANMAHRALPDAYVTAFILRELLDAARVQDLIAWTKEPVLLPRMTFGRHRGCSWTDVPDDFLGWIVERSDLGDDIKFT